jgi:hypothetical protein
MVTSSGGSFTRLGDAGWRGPAQARPRWRVCLAAGAALLSVVHTACGGANLSGAWEMHMDPDFSGKPSVEHCLMKQGHGSSPSRADNVARR